MFQKSLLVSFQRCWTQWQRFESFSTHHFWDNTQHFLKRHFWWESGFLSFLVLQKFLLVNFQGCWAQWQRFESSSTNHFWDTPQYSSKQIFGEKVLSVVRRAPEFRTSKFSGVLNTMVKVWKLYHSSFLRYPTAFPQTHFWWESGSLLFLELQKSLLVSFQGCWTQWLRFESCSIHCFWDTPLHFLKTHFAYKVAFFHSEFSTNLY